MIRFHEDTQYNWYLRELDMLSGEIRSWEYILQLSQRFSAMLFSFVTILAANYGERPSKYIAIYVRNKTHRAFINNRNWCRQVDVYVQTSGI